MKRAFQKALAWTDATNTTRTKRLQRQACGNTARLIWQPYISPPQSRTEMLEYSIRLKPYYCYHQYANFFYDNPIVWSIYLLYLEILILEARFFGCISSSYYRVWYWNFQFKWYVCSVIINYLMGFLITLRNKGGFLERESSFHGFLYAKYESGIHFFCSTSAFFKI